MEKKTLLAVVLSILVIMTFQMWMGKKHPQIAPQGAPAARVVEPLVAENTDVKEAIIAPEDEEELTYETDRFLIIFSNQGGAIKRIGLKQFADTSTQEPHLLAEIENPRYYTGAFKLLDYGGLDTAVYTVNQYDNTITYTYKTSEIEVNKRYTIRNYNDYIELDVIINNTSGKTMRSASSIIGGSHIFIADKMARRYANASAKVDGKLVRDRRNSIRPGGVSWVALNSKYFTIILRPYQLGVKAFTNLVDKTQFVTGLETAQLTIAPASRITQQYMMYIGPLDTNRLKALEVGLEEAVNYGIFDGISKLLLKTLRFIQKITRNWGVAIICLTMLVNLMLLPLTRKSYKSMKAMQDIQPEIEKLRNAHKNNPQKLNKELMELYKTYKVNPLGGCLPMLLQMPIFISLYHALVRSIELRGANFLWIKDLSKPDAVGLPVSLPIIGNSINILPILMMAAMIVQQKISTPHKSGEMSEQQKQQQNMMLMMPVIFVIIFYSLPSGLVMYWLVNTVLMAAHQYHIKRAPSR